MNLLERAKNIIITPKTEWEAVANEEPNIQQILMSYVLPLALIPTFASIIGWGLVGNYYYTSFGYGIAIGLEHLMTAFLSVLIAGFVIDALAPSFGSQKNTGRAVQLVAFSMTPIWVAGILNIVPTLDWLSMIIGFYGLYLLYLGLTPIMKTMESPKIGYLVVSIIIFIVDYAVLMTILKKIFLAIFGLSELSAMSFY